MRMDLLSTLRSKAEQAEVYTVQSESTLVTFEANEMKSATVKETQGIALRALVDGRLGFTAASGRIVEEDLVRNVLASARYGDEVPIEFPPFRAGPRVDVYDPHLVDVPISRFVEIGREIIAALRVVDEDGKIGVEIERSIDRSSLRNSAGAETTEKATGFSVVVSVERVRGDDVLIAFDYVSGISLTDEYHDAVERLARKVELAKTAARLESGRMPVLFSPTGAFVLALPLILATNGQNVQRGTSPLSERLGDEVFDPQLTLWDDPTLNGRRGSSSHDDEGVPCFRKALIVRGTCEGFLYDLKTAALTDRESTGNGSRGLFSTPSPSPSNLVVEAGKTPFADILADIDRGLLVEHALGVGQGNPISGAFSNTLGLAYVVEGGEIVGRVKDVSIGGNIYDELREVAAISEESYWVYGQIRLPYILLPSLNVVSKGQGVG
jgi:PmbA protein